METQRRICDERGYCGPFVNGHVYDSFPDPAWHGLAECVQCCSTVHRAREEAKLAGGGGRERRVAPAAPPPDAATPRSRSALLLGL